MRKSRSTKLVPFVTTGDVSVHDAARGTSDFLVNMKILEKRRRSNRQPHKESTSKPSDFIGPTFAVKSQDVYEDSRSSHDETRPRTYHINSVKLFTK